MSSNKLVGGYDLDWLEDPPDDLKCLICLGIARDPQQHLGNDTNECGKIFCNMCITKYLRKKKTCPNCQNEVVIKTNLFRDAKSARQIRSLKVKCNNLENACKWTGELSSLETHLQSCDYTLIPCTNQCSVVPGFPKKDLPNHLANDCPRRQYECPHCQEMGEHQERTTTHLDTCPKVKTQCLNIGCQDMIARCDIQTHQSKCKYEILTCKYSSVGCNEKPWRKDLETHENDSQAHLQVTIEKVYELSQKIYGLSHKVALLEAAAMANVKLEDGSNVHTEWVKSITSVTRSLRLTDYQEHKSSYEEFYTPSFYTSSNGYKMCLRVDANGNARGTDTHVSVYACLMKGDHDDTLTWPFTGSVTVELLNQLEDKNHFEETLTFSGYNIASKRVVDVERAKRALGLPKFIPHAALNYNATINTQYLKNDTLLFRFTVKVPQVTMHQQ